jgi:hypothetical protein
MNTDELKDRMRAEAIDSSPRFNAVLHERIMRRVERPHGQQAGRGTHQPRRRGVVWSWMGSMAAAIAVAVGGWYATTPAPKPVVRVPTVRVEPVVAKAVEFRQRVNARAMEYRLAYLDHDARQLKDFLVRQVDVLPSKQ